jgi:hypothetical protein
MNSYPSDEHLDELVNRCFEALGLTRRGIIRFDVYVSAVNSHGSSTWQHPSADLRLCRAQVTCAMPLIGVYEQSSKLLELLESILGRVSHLLCPRSIRPTHRSSAS